MISMPRQYKAVTEHLSCDLNGEAVILNMKNGKYYGVNEIGSTIWTSIQEPASFEDIKLAVMQEYDIDEGTCHSDIKSFLEKMVEEDLVDTIDEAAS